jgi:alanine-synthesizing transaminase
VSEFWHERGLSVEEAARALGVTPKSVNERIRHGYHEEWKSIDNVLTETSGVRVFVRGHGFRDFDQVDLEGVSLNGSGESPLNARWTVRDVQPDSFRLDGSAALGDAPWHGGRVRRVHTIRTASFRRADLGRKMRLCNPDDIRALERITRPANGRREEPMTQRERSGAENSESGGIFDDKPFYRIGKLPPYVFAVINEMRHKARQAGLDVIDLGMGNPDGATPKTVINKLNEAARDKRNHRYSMSKGIPRLRDEIVKRYRANYGVELDPETEAIVTMGAKDSLAHLLFAVIGPGDPVVMPDPAYPIHQWGASMAEGEQRALPMPSPAEFLNRLEDQYKKAATPPKMILVSFPHNPTTQVVDRDFFETLVGWAHQHGTMIVHDFAYADLCFDGYKAPSILEIPGAKDVAVEIFSMSKSYNMAGWRVGFCLGNKKMIHALARIKSYLDYGVFQPIQIASIIALRECEDDVKQIREGYRHRRDVLVEGLHRAGWMVEPPKATMFLWAKIPERYAWAGSLEFAKLTLNKALVAVSPGIGFGQEGEGYVRFSFIENDHRLRQACRGIKKLLAD